MPLFHYSRMSAQNKRTLLRCTSVPVTFYLELASTQTGSCSSIQDGAGPTRGGVTHSGSFTCRRRFYKAATLTYTIWGYFSRVNVVLGTLRPARRRFINPPTAARPLRPPTLTYTTRPGPSLWRPQALTLYWVT